MIEIFENKQGDAAVLVCDTAQCAFGPIIRSFEESEYNLTPRQVAIKFIKWLPLKINDYDGLQLVIKYSEFTDHLQEVVENVVEQWVKRSVICLDTKQ